MLPGAYFFTAGGAGVGGLLRFLAFVFYAVVAFVNR